MSWRSKNGKREWAPRTGKVQLGSKGGKLWSAWEDKKLLAVPQLTDAWVGRLSFDLGRPPSEIRTRHVFVHNRAAGEAAERKKLAEAIMAKRNPRSRTQDPSR